MNQNLSTAVLTERPTRVRYGVLGFACTLSMITYLDRVRFAQAARPIANALGYEHVENIAWAFTAFALSYAIFEIPTGWLGDVFGPRKTLIRIVLWWSGFTALTAMVGLFGLVSTTGLIVLMTIRFLFGVGEAGAYPNITRALHNWLPFGERGLGQGSVWMAGRFMGGMTPLVWMLLVGQGAIDWRTAFWLFGILGVLWCIPFALWFRNRPRERAEVNRAEMELIEAGRHDTEAGHANVPWLRLFTNLNLWFLCIMYFCAAFAWYFNITYLPDYMEEQHGIGKTDIVGALFKGGPLWMGAITCLVGGFASDWFIRRTGNRKWGRRLFGVIGHGLCAVCFLLCPFMETKFGFFLAISFAAFWNDLTMGAAWATCQDIGRRYAAIVAGFMNTIGNLGGAIAGTVTGLILGQSLKLEAARHGIEQVKNLSRENPADLAIIRAGHLNGYNINFFMFAAVCVIAVVCWMMVDATKPVIPEEGGPPPPAEEAIGPAPEEPPPPA